MVTHMEYAKLTDSNPAPKSRARVQFAPAMLVHSAYLEHARGSRCRKSKEFPNAYHSTYSKILL